MRPRGEVREALANAAKALGKGGTWRELAARAKVSLSKARQVIKDMVKAGELVAIGERREPHSKRPLAIYAYMANQASTCGGALQALMGAWVGA